MAYRYAEFDHIAPLGRLGDYFSGLFVWRLADQDLMPASSILRISDPAGHLPLDFAQTGHHTETADFLWVDEDGTFLQAENSAFFLNSCGDISFSTNEAIEQARAGDPLFLLARPRSKPLVAVTPKGSTLENQLLWLFDLPRESGGFAVADPMSFAPKPIGIPESIVLASLGLVPTPV